MRPVSFMKSFSKHIRSVGVFLLVWGMAACGAAPEHSVEVSPLQWDCARRPCRVSFELTNPWDRALAVRLVLRGYNTTADWGPPPPKLFVGKREIRVTVPARDTLPVEVPVKFSRIPMEIQAEILEAEPAGG